MVIGHAITANLLMTQSQRNQSQYAISDYVLSISLFGFDSAPLAAVASRWFLHECVRAIVCYGKHFLAIAY